MSQFKSWGVLFNPNIYYAVDHECRCEAKLDFTFQARVPLMVGFEPTEPRPEDKDRLERNRRVGIGIFQCHECHELFWFHLNLSSANLLKELAPQWPK